MLPISFRAKRKGNQDFASSHPTPLSAIPSTLKLLEQGASRGGELTNRHSTPVKYAI